MKKVGDGLLEKHKNIILDGFDPVASHGFTQVPNFILRAQDLSPGAKLTYSMLLSYAWQNDFSFPGQEKLASDIGVGKRTVIRHLKELQENGVVTIKRRGLGQPNVYTLCATVKKKLS